MKIYLRNIKTGILLFAILFFELSSPLSIVSADDIPGAATPGDTGIGTDPIKTDTSNPEEGIGQSLSENTSNTVESFEAVVDQIAETGNEILDENGNALPMASQQTADILSGDPYFADPIDPAVARVFLKDCTGWILPAGFTSGTCTATDTPVQNAINAATSGTTIYVAPGHYAETVSIYSNNIAIIGLGGDAIVDRLNLFSDLNDSTQNFYSPLVHVFPGGNFIDATNLLQPGGQIVLHSKDQKKKGSQVNPGDPSSLTTNTFDTIDVNGSEIISFSCSKPFELILPSGTKVRSTSILCGYSGSLSTIGLAGLPGNMNDQYQFIEGVSLVMRNAGNPVIALPGSSKFKIQFSLPGNIDPSLVSILGWDQNLNNGTGDWVTISSLEITEGFATITANYPGYFILVIK
jgi:hypothetical protein